MGNVSIQEYSAVFFQKKELLGITKHKTHKTITTNKVNAAACDYFIHGHGVQAKTFFIVPVNVCIRFYVKEGKLFDDIWMKTIRKGSLPPQLPRFADFERSEFKSGQTCPDYNLMYPTGLCVDFSVHEQSDITAGMLVFPGKNNLMMPLGEGEPFKKPTTETRSLNWIITELQKKYFGKITLHWCACREETNLSLDEWTQNQIAKGSLRKRVSEKKMQMDVVRTD